MNVLAGVFLGHSRAQGAKPVFKADRGSQSGSRPADPLTASEKFERKLKLQFVCFKRLPKDFICNLVHRK